MSGFLESCAQLPGQLSAVTTVSQRQMSYAYKLVLLTNAQLLKKYRFFPWKSVWGDSLSSFDFCDTCIWSRTEACGGLPVF